MDRRSDRIARGLVHSLIALCAVATLGLSAEAATTVDGFDSATVDRFMRDQAASPSPQTQLNEARRGRMARLAETSERFRLLAVTDPGRLRASLSPNGQALVTRLFGENVESTDAHLWRFFFEGSLTYFGHAFADRARVGFYNPELDGWVLADWRDVAPGTKDERLELAGLIAVTGDTMRDATRRLQPAPAWIALSASAGAARALMTSHSIAVAVFEKRYPSLGTSDAGDGALRDEAIVLKGRIGDTARKLAQLDGDARYSRAVAGLRDALVHGDAAALAASFGGNDPGPVQRIAGLARPIREMLRPEAVVVRPQGRTVLLGVPFSGRWVLVATYDDVPDASAPKLASLVFLDLAAVEVRQ